MAHEPILIGETARILRVGEDTARQYADSGKLAVTRTRSGVRIFSREEVERFAATRARASRPRGAKSTIDDAASDGAATSRAKHERP